MQHAYVHSLRRRTPIDGECILVVVEDLVTVVLVVVGGTAVAFIGCRGGFLEPELEQLFAMVLCLCWVLLWVGCILCFCDNFCGFCFGGMQDLYFVATACAGQLANGTAALEAAPQSCSQAAPSLVLMTAGWGKATACFGRQTIGVILLAATGRGVTHLFP